jgi:hypothetical protein
VAMSRSSLVVCGRLHPNLWRVSSASGYVIGGP